MFLKKFPRLSIIFITGHNVQRNPCSGFIGNLKQVGNELFKNIEVLVNPDIEHSFGLVKAKSGSLSPSQKNCSGLSFTNRRNPHLPKFLFPLPDFSQFHRP